MTTVIRGGDPDLIATAFYGLGFRARNSVIVVGLEPTGAGGRLRTGRVIARYDVPPARDRGVLARDVAAILRSMGCPSCALVVASGGIPDARGPARAIRTALRRHRIDVRNALLVGADTYRDLDCADPTCCPPAGRPLQEVWESRVATAHVAQGVRLALSEEELVADVVPGPAEPTPAPAEQHDALLTDGQGGVPVDRRDVLSEDARRAAVNAWRLVLDGRLEGVPPTVAESLRDVLVRDGVLLLLGGGPEEGTGSTDPWESFMRSAPDEARARRATVQLAAVARTARPEVRVEAIAVLAWLAWCRGEGARARLLVAEVRRSRPGHRLSLIVEDALIRAVPPPWVLRPGQPRAVDDARRTG